MTKLIGPAPLAGHHNLDAFSCGVDSLDTWLKKRARSNESSRASRTFVVCDADQSVIGYYALAAGALATRDAPGKIRRNMPDPIPAVVLGRLAVDQKYQGQKMGKSLLLNALLRTLKAAESIGIKVIVVHAISEEAKKFYLARRFIESPEDPMTLMLPVAAIAG